MQLSSSNFSRRITVGVTVFVLCCLFSSVRVLVGTPWPGSLRNSPATVVQGSDHRFAALKAALPQRGVVGYTGESGTDAVVLADYYLTQYALAPLVVDRSPNHALVVGNFPSGRPAQSPSENLRLVKDFGNGVLLFATKDTN